MLDYYAGGSLLPGRYSGGSGYRYGFNGHEKDDEIKGVQGSSYDFGARMYDPRLLRFTSTDPWEDKYPWQTPYAYYANSPIWKTDWKGNGAEGDKDETPTTSFGSDKEGLTTTRLRSLARESGITGKGVNFSRKVGKAFETLAKVEFLMTGPPKQYSTPARGAKYGKGFKTIPDGTNTVTVNKLEGRYYRSEKFKDGHILEVKATKGALRLSTSKGQIKAIIDIAARSSAGKEGRGGVTFITTADTYISDGVLEYATSKGVQVFQSWAEIDSDNNISFTAPSPMNIMPGRVSVPFAIKQLHLEYGQNLLFMGSHRKDLPNDADPEIVE